jgi:hypothetical protein
MYWYSYVFICANAILMDNLYCISLHLFFMKKYKIIITLIFLSCMSIVLYFILHEYDKKIMLLKNITIMPQVELYKLDSNIFNYDILDKNFPTFIMYFNSYCNHCHYQLLDVFNHYSYLDYVNILMISSESLERLSSIKNQYSFKDFPKIHLLHIDPILAINILGVKRSPSLYLYDKNKILIKKIEGEIKMDLAISIIIDKNEYQ